MDSDAIQCQRLVALATHHALDGMSEHPGQLRQDPITALLNQCRRARAGQDAGMDYMHVPF